MYKTVLYTLALLSIIAACNQSKTPENEEKTATNRQSSFDTSNFQALDLSKYNVNRKLYVTKGKEGNEAITQSANGNIEVNFDQDYLIEIVPNPLPLAVKKEELKTDPLYNINYIEEAEDYLFYSKNIENSGIDPEYHFYILLEGNNGPIAVKTHDMLQLNKEKAEAILNHFKKQRNLPA